MVIDLDDSTGPISPGGGNTGNSMLTAGQAVPASVAFRWIGPIP